MNEITNFIKAANTAIKTVRLLDIAKKVVAVSATVVCCATVVKLCMRKPWVN